MEKAAGAQSKPTTTVKLKRHDTVAKNNVSDEEDFDAYNDRIDDGGGSGSLKFRNINTNKSPAISPIDKPVRMAAAHNQAGDRPKLIINNASLATSLEIIEDDLDPNKMMSNNVNKSNNINNRATNVPPRFKIDQITDEINRIEQIVDENKPGSAKRPSADDFSKPKVTSLSSSSNNGGGGDVETSNIEFETENISMLQQPLGYAIDPTDMLSSPQNVTDDLGEPRATYSYLKSYFVSMLQPSDNKLAMKLFGSKKGVLKEKLRQQEVGHWIIHPCSNFR